MNTSDFKERLATMGLGAFADCFASEGYDDPQFWNEIDHDELKAMGFKRGHLMKWDKYVRGQDDAEKGHRHRSHGPDRHRDIDSVDSKDTEHGFDDEEKDSVEDGREKFDFGAIIAAAAPLVSQAVSALTKDIGAVDEDKGHEKFILPLISAVAPMVVQAVSMLLPNKKDIADHDVDAFVAKAVQNKDLWSAMMTTLDVAAAALPAVQGALHGQKGMNGPTSVGVDTPDRDGREKFDFSSLISAAAPLVAQAVTALTKDIDAQKALNGAVSEDEGHEKFILPLITTVAPLVMQAVSMLIPKKKTIPLPSNLSNCLPQNHANSKSVAPHLQYCHPTQGMNAGPQLQGHPAHPLPPINIYYGYPPQ
jgi:hypothetical protein